MEAHYICTGGCGGVSNEAGTCQAPDCADFHTELKECHCKDGEHKMEEKSE